MSLPSFGELHRRADALASPVPVAVAGGADATVLEAMRVATDRGWAEPILVGVAAEVRRLAAMSSDAAERTQRAVADVLGGVERSSETMERMAATTREVQRATEVGSDSFAQLEGSVAELETWTAAIEGAATGTNALVAGMNERLDAVSRGTEAFAAAMQEVAAASQQQSASTEQIAAAAASMAHAAERLAKLVTNLQIGEGRRGSADPAAASAASG